MKYEINNIIKDLVVFEPNVFYDHRGEYINTYNVKDYEFLGNDFLEDDFSISKKNVLRGLHGDSKTKKLIQCLYGEIMLAVADLRESSPSYLKVQTFMVNDKNRIQVLVPEGCVNGHLCLSRKCIFSYKQTELYSGAQNQISVRFDDPWLNIPWPAKTPILSSRDYEALYLKDMEERCRKL